MSLSVQIKKKLGSFLLDVSFENDGGMLALLGASGCGKSMTLKCIAGIERPDSGRIVLNGRTLFDSEARIDLPPQKRRVGYLFQQYALFPNMTVRQNLAAAVRRLPKQARNERIGSILTRFRLEGLAERRPEELSSGQQQRVALARILLSEPEVLLLDEPFSALDDALRWKLELELMDHLERFSGDVLFVSHSRDEVTRLCRRVCVLTQGRSDRIQTVKELMRAPRTLSAARLSGCKNFSAAHLRVCQSAARSGEESDRGPQKTPRGTQKDNGEGLVCADWGVTLQAAGPVPGDVAWAGIRAHSLRFEPAANAVACRVSRVIDNVFSYIVMLQTPGQGQLRMEFDKGLHDPPEPGAALTVYIEPEDILLLTD